MMMQDSQRDGDVREQYDKIVRFLRRSVRFWPSFLGVVAVGVIACVVFLTLRKPNYRSETLILYTEGIRSVDATPDPSRLGPRDATVRLREMLLSRPRLLATIEKFGLYPETVEKYGPVDAADELRDNVDFRAPGGDTFSIAFKGKSAEQSQAVTKHLADSLMEDEGALRRAQTRQQREFLTAEWKKTEEALKKAERAIAQFLAEHPELAADAMLLMPGASTTGAAIRAATEPTLAPTQAPASVTRWQALPAPGGAGAQPVAPGAGGAPIAITAEQRREIAAAKTRAETDLAAAESAFAEKSARFTELHPDVRALKTRVARERARVNAASAALAAITQQSVQVGGPGGAAPERRAVRRVRVATPGGDQAAKPDDQASKREELVELETQWARLTRTAAESRAKNDRVEASLFKADLAAKSETGGMGANMVVLDPAFLPARPMPPGRLTIAGIFVALSLLLGSLLVAGRAAIDDRVYAACDIERMKAVLAEVPPLSAKPQSS
jgi:uncharacterized protein involved in exopolysaccharide biosynthesis